LRILDALFVALDTAKYSIEWASPYTSPVNVTVLSEQIGVSLAEVIERKQQNDRRRVNAGGHHLNGTTSVRGD